MASPHLLNFEELLAPIAGENPAGEPLPFALREQLNEARKEIDLDTFEPDDPMRPSEPKKADWPGIIRLAQQTLTETSKDLLVAARLTEALVKQHGFAGVRDGLHLFAGLFSQCWDRLYPGIEDGDLEVRAGPLSWLDDADRGARFPTSLRRVPLLIGEEGTYDWLDWRLSQDGRGEVSREAFEKAIAATPREHCQTLVEDLAQCYDELKALETTLHDKLGEAAPGMTAMRRALDDCSTLAGQVLQRKGPAPIESAASGDAGADSSDGRTVPARAMASRADVYQRLAEAADLLQQLEPHSPIPYLIRRAVALGALPFPQLMKALIREDSVLHELNREMGIKDEQTEE
ncbi:MAG TPA: type VI secretion system protein TssA [Gemmataceae bacterium]|nr:type VI secretion system protein TssA [Gemmataceae bacterium]